MLKIKLTIFLTFSFFFSFSQFQTKEYDFKPFDLKLGKQIFNLVEVFDNRDFSHVYGKEFFLSNEYTLVNHSDFANDVKNWYNIKYPINPNLPNIAIKIQDISFYTNRIKFEPSSCIGLINIYLVKGGRFFLISEYKSKVYGKVENYPYSIVHDVFSTITPELIQNANLELEDGIEKIEKSFLNDFTKPIPGLYKYFEDFKYGNPSVSLTNNYADVLPKDQKINFWLGSYKRKMIQINGLEIPSEFWGFSDGRSIFMRLNENFFVKLMKYDETFYFDTKNIELKEKKNGKIDFNKMLVSTFFINYSSAMLFLMESVENPKKDYFFALNKKNGTIIDFIKNSSK